MIIRKGIIGLPGGGSNGIWITSAIKTGGTFLDITNSTSLGGSVTSIIGLATDATQVTLTIIGDRNNSYEPVVTVNGVMATRVAGNTLAASTTGTFQWSVTVNVTATIVISASDGSSFTLPVTLAVPAVVSNLTIVNNPASGNFFPVGQTELKAGDIVYVDFTTDIDINNVQGSTNTGGSTALTPGTIFTGVALTVAATGTTATELTMMVQTTTVAGAVSTIEAVSLNTVLCNNLYPTALLGVITYPATQTGLKDSETASVDTTLLNYDSLIFSSPNVELSLNTPTVAQDPIVVTRIAGAYNVSVANLRVVATRVANNAVTTTNRVVNIANVIPVLSISELSPMESGGNDGTSLANHTITVTSSQRLASAPAIVAPEGTLGTMSYASTSTTFTVNLSVSDNDAKGAFTWTSLSATGISGMLTTVITGEADYTLSGIKSRVIAVPPFADTVTVNASLDSPATVTVTWDFTGVLTYNAADVLAPNQFTILNILATSFDIKLLDAAKAAASSQASSLTVGQ